MTTRSTVGRWACLCLTFLVGCSPATTTDGGMGGGGGNVGGGGGNVGGGVGGGGGAGGGSGGGGGMTADAGGDDAGLDAGLMATGTVGVDGGTVASGAFSLAVPPAAVDEDTTITVTQSQTAPPADAGAVSALYVFEPDGTVFARPLRLEFPVPAGVTNPTLFWSRTVDGGVVYEDLGGEVVNGKLVAEVMHFSSGFVGTASSTRTVTGARVRTYVSQSHPIENVPVDLTTSSVEALVAEDGGYRVLPGVVYADGTFSVPAVPQGRYWLKFTTAGSAPLYLETDQGVLDLGAAVAGRRDRDVVSLSGTRLTFDVTNLAPYQPGDLLEVLAIDVDTWSFQGDSYGWCPLTNRPDAGVTSTRYTVDLWSTCGLTSSRASGLVKTSRGDTALFAQLSGATTDAGLAFQTMKRTYQPASLDMVDGMESISSGAMTDVTASASVTIDFRASAFSNAATVALADGGFEPALTPPGRVSPLGPTTGRFAVQGQPGSLDFGQYSATADYAYFAYAPGSPDFSTGSIDYGQPASAAWGVFIGATMDSYAAFRLGTGQAAFLRGGVLTNKPLVEASSAPFAPLLSGPRNVRVGGQAVSGDVTGVGLTPSVTWDAPTTGSPSYYRLSVQRLSLDASQNTVRQTIGQFSTTQTRVDLPPGTLTSGGKYAFVLSAITSAYPNPVRSPFRSALPEGSAVLVTGLVEP